MEAENKKHAAAVKLILDAITDASNEELRAKNQISGYTKMVRTNDDPVAGVLLADARDELAKQEAAVASLWDSVQVLIGDRKASGQ
jgi:hypothetical protein